MSWFDSVVDAAKKAAEAAASAVQGAADAVQSAVHAAADAVDQAADTAGMVVQGALNGARGWVNDNWGDTPWGAVGRAVIDALKIGAAVLEFAVHLAAAGAVLVADVVHDAAHGDWSKIPGRFDDFGKRVEKNWRDAIEDMNTFAIVASVLGRDVAGVPKQSAKAWSVAAGLALTKKGQPDPRTYRSTGKRYEFKLDKGEVSFREVTMTCAEPEFVPLVFRETGFATMMSFNNKRTGDGPGGADPRNPAPQFEAIVASADRVFAKELGKDNFYFLLMDELFWGPPELRPDDDLDQLDLLPMPSNYVKLDPEKHLVTAKQADLVAGLAGPLPIIPQSERHAVFREATRAGLLDLVVKVIPRVWYLIDTRPAHGSLADLPDDYPAYDHVTYGSQTTLIGGLNKSVERSIDFVKVLDIGVGNTHFHEQWTNIYSGEMRNTRLEYFQNLAVGEFNYSVLNGPLSDGDHWADGTCNFYLLVQLAGEDKRFAVLYCDEQTFFTQRWRLADPKDKQPVAFDKMNFSLAAALDDKRDGLMHGFRMEHFWSPFGNRYLNERSRMSVSRTVVVLSGKDPGSGKAELYSVNYGYGVCDRTWRCRDLSQFNVLALSENDVQKGTLLSVEQNTLPNAVFPETLHVREDMQITMRGTARAPADLGQDVVRGIWAQSYLPANGQQVPSREEHAAQTSTTESMPLKPALGFMHPWTFWSDNAFKYADRFSHLGVYTPVDERIQFYLLDMLDGLPVDETGKEWFFRDDPALPAVAMGQLYIKARKLNWNDIGGQLKELQRAFLVSLASVIGWIFGHAREMFFEWEVVPASQSEAEAQFRASRRSMYNHDGRFILHYRGRLGWIAVWKDKRDDDLISLSDLPMEASLVQRADETRQTRVRFKGNQRVYQPPVVQQASVVLRAAGAERFLDVEVRSDRTLHEADINLWCFHLAALDCDSRGMVVFLLQDKRFSEMTHATGPSGITWKASYPVSETWLETHQRFLGERGRQDFGTSLWFENIVGQVACAEELRFAPFIEKQRRDLGTIEH